MIRSTGLRRVSCVAARKDKAGTCIGSDVQSADGISVLRRAGEAKKIELGSRTKIYAVRGQVAIPCQGSGIPTQRKGNLPNWLCQSAGRRIDAWKLTASHACWSLVVSRSG